MLRAVQPWPRTEEEALAVQDALLSRVVHADGPPAPATVAGLDVAYSTDDQRLAAAVVVLNTADLSVVDTAVVRGTPAFGYVPGLFAFREVPALLAALEQLTVRPEVLICDGHGLAHPRRFGLAAHLGVLTDLPSFGVGKTRLVGEWEPVGVPRGSRSPLVDRGEPGWGEPGRGEPGRGQSGRGEPGRGETVGAVLRTQTGVKPVFVSVGHRIGLDRACDLVLHLTPRYRLPETTRIADRVCRDLLS